MHMHELLISSVLVGGAVLVQQYGPAIVNRIRKGGAS